MHERSRLTLRKFMKSMLLVSTFFCAFTLNAQSKNQRPMLYSSAIGQLRFSVEGRAWVLRAASDQNACGFAKDFEVFRGDALRGMAEGNLSSCRVDLSCAQNELSRAVFSFARGGEIAVMAVEAQKGKCPRAIASHGLFLTKVRQGPIVNTALETATPVVVEGSSEEEKCTRAGGHTNEGARLLAAGELSAARAQYIVAAQLCEELPSVRIGLSEIALKRGQGILAERLARELIDANPLDAENYRRLARILKARGYPEEAKRFEKLARFISPRK